MNVSLASLRSEITHECVVLIFCVGVHFCKILRTRLLHVQSEEELEKKTAQSVSLWDTVCSHY